MTYVSYALYPGKAYLIATGNDRNHTEQYADIVLTKICKVPYAVVTGAADELKLNATLLTIDDLIKSKEN